MAAAKPLKLVVGKTIQMASTDVIPIANLAIGTPTGLKFIRDDGTLQVAKSPATKMFNYLNYS